MLFNILDRQIFNFNEKFNIILIVKKGNYLLLYFISIFIFKANFYVNYNFKNMNLKFCFLMQKLTKLF